MYTFIDLNVNGKAMLLLEDNTGAHHYDLWAGRDPFNMPPKALAVKVKTGKLDCIKTLRCSLKDVINEVMKQVMAWENICETHGSEKRTHI